MALEAECWMGLRATSATDQEFAEVWSRRNGSSAPRERILLAIGQVLAVELANRESRSSWRDFLLGLKARGLHGVEFVVADDHAGLRAALREVLAEAAYQRCYVHFLRNALDYVPRKSLPSRKRGRRRLPARAALAL